MKALIALTTQDKLTILFDLFPNERTSFIVYLLEATNAVRRTEILNKLLWHHRSLAYIQFKKMVDQVEAELLQYMNAKIDSPAELCRILGNPEVFYWIQKSLLGYLCLETDPYFAKAYELFFNPNPPKNAPCDNCQLLNN